MRGHVLDHAAQCELIITKVKPPLQSRIDGEVIGEARGVGGANDLLLLIDDGKRKTVPPLNGIDEIEALRHWQRQPPPRDESVRSVPAQRTAALAAENGIFDGVIQ